MLIKMHENADKNCIKQISNILVRNGVGFKVFKEKSITYIGIFRGLENISTIDFKSFNYIESIENIKTQYRLASKKMRLAGHQINVQGKKIGQKKLMIISGPCSVESEEQILDIAKDIKQAGASFLRGGTFKPRSSPYSFAGLGKKGLRFLKTAADLNGLKTVSEITDIKQLDFFYEYCDMIQIGARNMQNFELLKELGKIKKPILLKRGFCATIEEFLNAAEYILLGGNLDVVLCERGIRTFENSTRYTLDISSIPLVKQKSSLPIIIDPSHASGNVEYINSLTLGAVAAGADGIMIEVHNAPENAKSDAKQQILPQDFASLMQAIAKVAKAVGRTV